MWNVLVTKKIPAAGIELLRRHCQSVTVNPEERVWTEQELIEHLPGNQGVLCLLTDRIDRKVLDKAHEYGIKGFATMAVGYDNIDVDYAAELGIKITNTPGVLTETTAELTWALIFAVSRRIMEADRFTRTGKFRYWEPMLFLGCDISHKTLGIVGAGRIGTAVGLMSRGFDMQILYCDTERNEILEAEMKTQKVPLDELLARADFITIHTPLTAETHHLIGEAEFGKMKPGAILINTSRGAVVEEDALVKVLKNGKIRGAGLDVYEHEPAIHPELVKMDNVVLLPHIGSASIETRAKMARIAAENLIAILADKPPPNLVTSTSEH